MKLLVIGSGGREHALVWKLSQSAGVDRIFCAPGNAGTAQLAENVAISATDLPALVRFAKENSVDLTVVGPDDPLAAAEEIQRRREELGFSYFVFGGEVSDALAPVVAELAAT